MSEFKLVRVGFDTIIVAFRASLPVELCEVLRDARARARDIRSDEPLEFGPGQVSGVVLSHGVHGGYDVVFSTGQLGELWQFKTEQKGDKWPLRMKVRAATLLVHGYPEAVDLGLARLKGFGIDIHDARLSEIHICVDVLTDASFRIDEHHFIRPGKAKVRPWEVFDRKHPLVDPDIPWDAQRVLQGLRLQSLTVGQPATGSQKILYDKRAEATAKRNWAIFEAYGLDKRNPDWSLWRFEARFRGDTLNRNYQLRTFANLDAKASEMLDWATSTVRYVAPGQESVHPTRRALDPFWTEMRQALPRLCAKQPSMILPSIARSILEREKISSLEASASGAIIARAAMTGFDGAQIQARLPQLAAAIVAERLRNDPVKARKSIERAISRARML